MKRLRRWLSNFAVIGSEAIAATSLFFLVPGSKQLFRDGSDRMILVPWWFIMLGSLILPGVRLLTPLQRRQPGREVFQAAR